MRVLAISGSLRLQSTNTALLRSLLLLAPSDLQIEIFEGLDQIPAFNPDLEGTDQLYIVTRFRRALQDCAAVLISTPEYAHGIPGVLKNALDWVVGSGELSQKPVALINASSRAVYAQAALREVLTAMNARVLQEVETTVDLPRKEISSRQIAKDSRLAPALLQALETLKPLL